MATYKLTQQSGNFAGSSKSDFPAYIDLTEIDAAMSQADADSIRVYSDASLSTELAREIVSTEEMHVKIPTFTSGDEIWVDIDGTRSDYATTDTFGAENVWSGYGGVWHLQATSDGTTGEFIDSTSNNNNGTGIGSGSNVPNTTTGKIGSVAQEMVDSNDEGIQVSHSASLNVGSGDFAISAWVKINSGDVESQDRIFSKQDGNPLYIIRGGAVSNAGLRLLFRDSGGSSVQAEGGDVTSVSEYHHFVAVLDGNTARFYVDATEAGTGDASSVGSLDNTADLFFGYDTGISNGGIDADFDEERLYTSGSISANWITTEYNNQNSPSTFWSVEEVVSRRIFNIS